MTELQPDHAVLTQRWAVTATADRPLETLVLRERDLGAELSVVALADRGVASVPGNHPDLPRGYRILAAQQDVLEDKE